MPIPRIRTRKKVEKRLMEPPQGHGGPAADAGALRLAEIGQELKAGRLNAAMARERVMNYLVADGVPGRVAEAAAGIIVFDLESGGKSAREAMATARRALQISREMKEEKERRRQYD